MSATMIVEDGSGVADANTYQLYTDADQFFSDLELTAWSLINDRDVKNGYLLQAAIYMEAMYAWRGAPLTTTQGLTLPTTLVPVNGRIRKAQAYLALAASKGDLAPENTTGSASYVREKLEGVGETEYHYDNAPLAGRQFPLVDQLLAPYTVTGPNSGIQQARRLVG